MTKKKGLISFIIYWLTLPNRLIRKKSFWVIAILAFYFFKVSLLSGIVTDFLEDAIDQGVGLNIAIDRFEGSIITSVALKGIALEEESLLDVGESLLELKIDILQTDPPPIDALKIEEVSVHYNFLAPLFGGRILNKIVLREANLGIKLEKVNASPSEPSAPLSLDFFKEVDFATLIEHSPDIEIDNISFSFQAPGQSAQVKNFSFHHLQKEGFLRLEYLLIEEEGKDSQEISDVDIEWTFQNKKLTLEKLSLNITGYPRNPFSLAQPFTIDLSEIGVYLADLNFLLPGTEIQGGISLEDGLKIEMQRCQVKLKEVLPLFFPVNQEQVIPDLKIISLLHIPQWDIRQLQGNLLFQLGEAVSDIFPPLQSKEEDRVLFHLSVEDLSALEKIVPQPKKMGLGGGLRIYNNLRMPSETIFSRGEIQTNKLKVLHNYLPDVKGKWDFSFTPSSNQVELSQGELSWGDIVCQAQGKIDLEQKEPFLVQGKVDCSDFSSFSSYVPGLGGALHTQFDLAGYIPSPLALEPKLDLSVKHELNIDNLSWQEKKWGDFGWRGSYSGTEKEFSLSEGQFTWNGEEILRAQGRFSQTLGEEHSLHLNFSLSELEKRLAFLDLPFSSRVSGALSGEVHLKANSSLDKGKAHFTVRLKEGALDGVPFQELKLVAETTLSPQGLQLRKLAFFWDGKKLIEVSGQWKRLQYISQLKTQLFLPHIPLTLWKKYQLEPLAGRLLLQAQVKLGSEMNFSQGQTQIKVGWKNSRSPEIPYDELKLATKGKWNSRQIKVENFTLRLEDKIFLQTKAQYNLKSQELQTRFQWKIRDLKDQLVAFQPELEKTPISGDFLGKLSYQGIIEENMLNSLGKLQLWLALKTDSTEASYKKLALSLKVEQRQKQIKLSSLQAKFDEQVILQSTGKIELERDFPFQGKITSKIPKISTYLALFFPQSPLREGDLSLDWQFQGKGPDLERGKIFSELNLGLKKATMQGKELPEIALHKTASLDQKKIHLSSFALRWAQEEVFSLEGNCAYGDLVKPDLKAQFQIKELSQIHSLLAPPNAPSLKGSFQGNFSIDGQVVPGNIRQSDLKTALAMSWDNLEIAQNSFPRIDYQQKLHLKPGSLEVEDWQIKYGDKEAFLVSGILGYEGGKETHLSMSSDLQLLNVLLAKYSDRRSPFEGVGELKVVLEGQVDPEKEILDLQNKVEVSLSPAAKNNYWRIHLNDILFSGSRFQEENPSLLDVNLHLSNWKNPQVEGKVSLYQNRIELKHQDFVLRRLSNEWEIDPTQISLQGSTVLGGGLLSWEGKIAHNNYLPENFQLQIKGQRLLLIRSEYLYGRADCQIQIEGKFNPEKEKKLEVKVGGKVDVTQFDVSIPMSMETKPKRVTQKPGVEIKGVDLQLDLQINLNKVSIKNNLAFLETKGTLSVRGSSANPEVSGWIRTDYGKLFLPQGVLNITDCLIRFSPHEPLVPRINLKGEAQIKKYLVTALIKGTPEELEIDFSSSPPLPQEDIITLLATGGTRKDLTESGGETLKQAGSSILLQQVLNQAGIGEYVSAQVTDSSGTVTISPPQWKGFAVQTKVNAEGSIGLNFLYRILFK